jgi:hypothetical protein
MRQIFLRLVATALVSTVAVDGGCGLEDLVAAAAGLIVRA